MSTINSAMRGLPCKMKTLVARMRKVSLCILVYLIWEERNKRTFDDKSTSLALPFGSLKSCSTWFSTFMRRIIPSLMLLGNFSSGCVLCLVGLVVVAARSYEYSMILHLLMGEGNGYFNCLPNQVYFQLWNGCCSSAWHMQSTYHVLTASFSLWVEEYASNWLSFAFWSWIGFASVPSCTWPSLLDFSVSGCWRCPWFFVLSACLTPVSYAWLLLSILVFIAAFCSAWPCMACWGWGLLPVQVLLVKLFLVLRLPLYPVFSFVLGWEPYLGSSHNHWCIRLKGACSLFDIPITEFAGSPAMYIYIFLSLIHLHFDKKKDWDLIPESRNSSDWSVTQWKRASRHQHYWNE